MLISVVNRLHFFNGHTDRQVRSAQLGEHADKGQHTDHGGKGVGGGGGEECLSPRGQQRIQTTWPAMPAGNTLEKE